MKGLNANQLKIIAVIAMTIDHLGWWLLSDITLLGQLAHTFGRITAPVMCFFVAEGFIHTSNVKKYLLRMFAFAAVSHFPFVLSSGARWYASSVILTLALGLLALYVLTNERIPAPARPLLAALCAVAAYHADWSFIGVLWIIAFYYTRGSRLLQLASMCIIGLALYSVPYYIDLGANRWYFFGILLAVIPLYLYNGERGRKNKLSKWGFYVYYPLHLAIGAVGKYLINGGF